MWYNRFLGGDNAQTIFSEFFIRWPRNFCAAFFLNILIAGPVSRMLLRKFQSHTMQTSEAVAIEEGNNDKII